MGNLSSVPLSEFKKDFKLDVLVETGTEGGGGIHTALRAGFKKVYSCDLNVFYATKAQSIFRDNLNIIIECGTSISFLKKLYKIENFKKQKKLFWLDAHLPKIEVVDKDIVFPLKEELLFLKAQNINKDVIVIDDACLFEPSLQPDNWKEVIARYTKVGIREDMTTEDIKSYFPNHNFYLNMEKEGMVILTPKEKCND